MEKKLTLVSLWHRGQRTEYFIHVPVSADGHAKLPTTAVKELALIANIPSDSTYSIGG